MLDKVFDEHHTNYKWYDMLNVTKTILQNTLRHFQSRFHLNEKLPAADLRPPQHLRWSYFWH